MSGVLLIGFDYDNAKENFLVGTISDLRMAYEFSLRSNLDSYLLITDIDFFDTNISYSPDDFSFLKKAINSRKLILLNPNSKENFLDNINSFLAGLDTVLVYYTGHADRSGIILSLREETTEKKRNTTLSTKKSVNILGIPDNMFTYEDTTNLIPETLFSFLNDLNNINEKEEKKRKKNNQETVKFKTMQNILYNKTNTEAQILYIMDCCHGGLGLPFVLNRDTGIYGLRTNKNITIPTQKIVCISSSLKSQNSISDLEGSLFTKEFFSIFNNNINYIDLVREIGHGKLNSYLQTLNIHSSRPNIKSPWHWCFGPSKMHIMIGNLITIDKLAH